MRDFEQRIQFNDPTAYEAINGSCAEPVGDQSIEPHHFSPRDYRLKGAALSRLFLRFPGEYRKKMRKQDPVFRSLLNEIALGNYHVLLRKEQAKGGV